MFYFCVGTRTQKDDNSIPILVQLKVCIMIPAYPSLGGWWKIYGQCSLSIGKAGK